MKVLWAIGSGGEKGAKYPAMEALVSREEQATEVAGVSAGALYAYSKALGNKKACFEKIKRISPENFKLPGFSLFHILWYKNMFERNSVYSDSALDNILKTCENKQEELKMPLTIGVFSQVYEEKSFDTSTAVGDVRQWVKASASAPLIFPPVKINNTNYSDGAMKHTFPVNKIINFCLEGGRNLIHIFCAQSLNRKDISMNSATMIPHALESLEARSQERAISDLQLIYDRTQSKTITNIFVWCGPYVASTINTSSATIKKLEESGSQAKKLMLEEWVVLNAFEEYQTKSKQFLLGACNLRMRL
jgi:predicted patatin/cPLA2 family phospholipase